MLYFYCNKNRKRVNEMKKINSKGFTLIELLAVITIMGILMIVAIPAVTRTIENTRKDTFIDTAKKYVGGAENMWAADNLKCGDYLSSAVATGTYYITVDSSSDSVPQLLEQGGKSPWGKRHMKGYIMVKVEDTTSGDVVTRKITYYPVITDGVHGVNVDTSGALADGSLTASDGIVRGSLLMSGAPATVTIPTGGVTCIEV